MWVNEQAKIAEEAVTKGEVKGLYNITRKLCKRKYQGMQPIKNKDGVLLTKEDDQIKRWQDHFKEILNPTVTEMIPTTSPPSSTDGCYKKAEKDEEKAMERPPHKDEIKEPLKNKTW
jgi:hypothetical protein